MAEHYLKKELYSLVQTDPEIFDFLQKSSLDGLWYWDLESPENEWMSPEMWSLFGIDPKTVQHKASEWQDLIHPADLQTALENFNAHAADPQHPYDQIVRYKHADGSTVWVRCRGLIIRDEEGVPKRMLGAHTDLTAVKEAELKLNQRLHTGNIRYDELLAALNQIIWSSNTDFEIEDIATKLSRHTGFTDKDLAGQQWINIVLEEDRITLLSELDALHKNPRKSALELSVWSSEHLQYRYSELQIVPIKVDGTLTEWIFCLEDVHERIKVHKALEDSNRTLSQTNQELEQFVYSASHDLKEPMRKTGSFAQLLIEQLKNDFPEALKNESIAYYLDRIQDASDRMGTLIDKLLEYSRVGRRDTTEWVDFGKVTTQVLEDLSGLIEPESTNIQLGDLPLVYCCPTDSYQLLLNLLTNAIKYRKKEGRHLIEVGTKDNKIYVKDTGLGIAPENQKRIFNLFERLHGRNDISGTGIGLSVCKKIVEQLGGSLTLESAINDGSTFYIELPDEVIKMTPSE